MLESGHSRNWLPVVLAGLITLTINYLLIKVSYKWIDYSFLILVLLVTESICGYRLGFKNIPLKRQTHLILGRGLVIGVIFSIFEIIFFLIKLSINWPK